MLATVYESVDASHLLHNHGIRNPVKVKADLLCGPYS